jgi:hypothetical protein
MSTFQEQYAEIRKQKEQQILQHALADEAFRSALVANPRETIAQELSINIPEDADVRVIEEQPNSFYMVLPPAGVGEGDELSDELLEAVAGGWWVELLWTGICFGTEPAPQPPQTITVTGGGGGGAGYDESTADDGTTKQVDAY